jgi:putative ABC transport system permease protein
MVKNILIIFWRKIRNGDIYSLINFIGLSIGLTACLLIFLYVTDELSFDRHHPEAKNTYRVLLHNESRNSTMSILPAVMRDYLDDKIPGVELLTRVLFIRNQVIFSTGDKAFPETNLAMADQETLEIFSFQFIQGNPSSALSEPNSIILTREAANKYFAGEDPMGKTLLFENSYAYIVTGLIEDLPAQSHFSFSMLASLESIRSMYPSVFTDWGNQGVLIYLQLSPNVERTAVEQQLTRLIWDANESFRDRIYYHLQPLLDIRLKSGNIEWDISQAGSITIVRVFSLIALLILALACFNFVNLSVALSVRRTKEIGIKKTLGAGRNQLIGQFMAETFVIVFFSLLLAGVLTELVLPAINTITGKTLSLNLFTGGQLPIFIIFLVILVSLCAGLYPAIVVSRFKPISAIQGHQSAGIRASRGLRVFSFTQMLMLLQFSVSTALMVVSLIIYLQMQFVSERDPGFQKEGLIAIRNPMDENMHSRGVWLKSLLQQHAGISSVSLSHNIPGSLPNNYSQFVYTSDEGEQKIQAALISCDEDLFTTLHAKIAFGRGFSREYSTDMTDAAIINSTMKARLGLEDPMHIHLAGFYDRKPRRIIGVVDDIHFASMHEAVGPMVWFINQDSYPQNYFNILARFKKGNEKEIIQYLEENWKQEVSAWPLQYHFVVDKLKEHYQDDRRTMAIVLGFAALAVLLSVLGLVGLALHTSSSRTKEIGIRKVLGAGIRDIIQSISREFGILVLVSNLIAWPVAWYSISRWLDNFAYRTELQWGMFLFPSLLIFIIAAMVMIGISYRAATQNPVVSLRGSD